MAPLIMLLLGLLLVGLTARLLIHAAVLPRVHLSMHLRQIDGYGFERAAEQDREPAWKRLQATIVASAERLGALTMEKMPVATPLKRSELAAAGIYDLSPDLVHGYRVIAAIALPAVVGLFVFALFGPSIITLLVIGGLAAGGWLLPAVQIRSKGQKRLNEIDRELPELIDVLIATVEAGMSVTGSIKLVANRFSGPLGDELKLTLRQQQLGISNSEAMNDMADRCDTPSVRSFVRTVTRSEAMGGSIGPILRELASDLRRRRRQAAEEKMQKAPVKMLFPLMFLIFPALMIELLYPAAYTLVHNLSSF
jgi:tight adherence protein C